MRSLGDARLLGDKIGLLGPPKWAPIFSKVPLRGDQRMLYLMSRNKMCAIVMSVPKVLLSQIDQAVVMMNYEYESLEDSCRNGECELLDNPMLALVGN